MKKTGIPRTAAAAKRRGYKPTAVDLKSLSSKEAKLWVQFDPVGLRDGQLAAMKRSPEPIEGMGSQPGYTKLCYYDKDTLQPTDCYDVPDSEIYYWEQHPDQRPPRR